MVENNETIWVFVDNNGYVNGWSGTKAIGAIEVDRTDNIIENWAFHKVNREFLDWMYSLDLGVEPFYSKEIVSEWKSLNPEKELLIFDESNILDMEKKNLLEEAREILENRSTNGLKLAIDGEDHFYYYNKNNKDYLNKIHDIMEKGYLESATFTFIKNGGDVSVELSKTNIHELWVLSYLHEENHEKNYSKVLEEINLVKTMDELIALGEKIRTM